MEQQEKPFDGARINGKEFPFVRVTVAKHKKICKKLNITMREAVLMHIASAGNKMREWKKIRSVAYVKTGLWKWMRIVPKELRCSQLDLDTAGGLKADFFDYVWTKVREHDRHLLSVKGSQIESAPKKSKT
jgi:hypothetical protein